MIPARPRPAKSAENREIDQYCLKSHIEGALIGAYGHFRHGYTAPGQGVPMGHPITLVLHIYQYLTYPRFGPAQKIRAPKHVPEAKNFFLESAAPSDAKTK